MPKPGHNSLATILSGQRDILRSCKIGLTVPLWYSPSQPPLTPGKSEPRFPSKLNRGIEICMVVMRCGSLRGGFLNTGLLVF